MTAIVVFLAAAGLTCVAVGVVRRRSSAHDAYLAMLLDVPGVPTFDASQIPTATLTRITEMLGLRQELHVPGEGAARARPRKDPVLLAGIAVMAALIVVLITSQPLLAVGAGIGVVAVVRVASKRAAQVRRRTIEAQVPDALLTMAAALEAGNPLRRVVQILAENGPQPLAGEIALVVAETELGTPLVDAFERMADRLGVRDLQWFARSLRIQQDVGGQLAPLVRTVADVMTARAHQQREARALTAEGRLSAWILGALPVLLILACQAMNPDYLAPMFRGWGLVVLAMCAASVATGIAWILRMINAEEAW